MHNQFSNHNEEKRNGIGITKPVQCKPIQTDKEKEQVRRNLLMMKNFLTKNGLASLGMIFIHMQIGIMNMKLQLIDFRLT